jgi:hypothetical protein
MPLPRARLPPVNRRKEARAVSKKDYWLIANALAASTVTANLTDVQREDLALEFAKALHDASGFTPNGNKSFKADLFMKAALDGADKTEFAATAVDAL